ncbi:hypothetical protein L210DRAFT_3505250 [Boletus edulis BED1]|uniref:DUF6533 domain-containing protein n=1 Tax=Boletus edulis BED1 TaxID=1328754 RepID=A0AAD4BQD5_BOLED|nr:hypothetical protein L210DRAFT_3505250 [Boletus edulis BED1]
MLTSSDPLSALEFLRINDYACFILVTAIIYDYLLTFSREIDYVWVMKHHPSSNCQVSNSTYYSSDPGPGSPQCFFWWVRYLGVSLAIYYYLYTCDSVSTLIYFPSHGSLTHGYFKGTAVTVVVFWQYVVFLAATDMVMIVRVYAMWNQSKWILGVLLFIYVSQVVSSLVMTGIISNPSAFHSVAGNQILGFSFCIGSWPNHMLIIYAVSLRLVLGIMLLVLAATQTLKQSVEMYKATGQWQPNQYFQQFTKDGIVYFVVNAVVNITGIITINTILLLVINTISAATLILLLPRFIIGVRELYDSKLHSWGTDTGFGVFEQPISSENVAVSTIIFVDLTPGQVVGGEGDESETIQLERLGDSSIHLV